MPHFKCHSAFGGGDVESVQFVGKVCDGCLKILLEVVEGFAELGFRYGVFGDPFTGVGSDVILLARSYRD